MIKRFCQNLRNGVHVFTRIVLVTNEVARLIQATMDLQITWHRSVAYVG